MSGTIEELVLNIGEKDKSANGLVPNLERDPLLIGLVRLVQQLRPANTSSTIQLKP